MIGLAPPCVTWVMRTGWVQIQYSGSWSLQQLIEQPLPEQPSRPPPPLQSFHHSTTNVPTPSSSQFRQDADQSSPLAFGSDLSEEGNNKTFTTCTYNIRNDQIRQWLENILVYTWYTTQHSPYSVILSRFVFYYIHFRKAHCPVLGGIVMESKENLTHWR